MRDVVTGTREESVAGRFPIGRLDGEEYNQGQSEVFCEGNDMSRWHLYVEIT
jgi:hypothetical protein